MLIFYKNRAQPLFCQWVAGFNGECVNGKCDCIRNGRGKCVSAEPPQTCHPSRAKACAGKLICDARYNLCTCAAGAVLLGSQCIPTATDGGNGTDLRRKSEYFRNRIRTCQLFTFSTIRNFVIINSLISVACSHHSECHTSSSCVSGNCYPHCTKVCPGYPNLQCTEGKWKTNKSLSSSFAEIFTNATMLIRIAIKDLRQIAATQICVESSCKMVYMVIPCLGICSLSCTTDADCDRNQFCSVSNGSCHTKCANENQCGRGQYCNGRQCQMSCSSGFSCPDGSVCNKHICESICTHGKLYGNEKREPLLPQI